MEHTHNTEELSIIEVEVEHTHNTEELSEVGDSNTLEDIDVLTTAKPIIEVEHTHNNTEELSEIGDSNTGLDERATIGSGSLDVEEVIAGDKHVKHEEGALGILEKEHVDDAITWIDILHINAIEVPGHLKQTRNIT